MACGAPRAREGITSRHPREAAGGTRRKQAAERAELKSHLQAQANHCAVGLLKELFSIAALRCEILAGMGTDGAKMLRKGKKKTCLFLAGFKTGRYKPGPRNLFSQASQGL